MLNTYINSVCINYGINLKISPIYLLLMNINYIILFNINEGMNLNFIAGGTNYGPFKNFAASQIE